MEHLRQIQPLKTKNHPNNALRQHIVPQEGRLRVNSAHPAAVEEVAAENKTQRTAIRSTALEGGQVARI